MFWRLPHTASVCRRLSANRLSLWTSSSAMSWRSTRRILGVINFDICVQCLSHLLFHLSHFSPFASSWRTTRLSQAHSVRRRLSFIHGSFSSISFCHVCLGFFTLLHLEYFHRTVLLDEFISAHVTTTNSNDQFTVDDLCKNLFGTEEILTRSDTLDRKIKLVLVQMESEQLINSITLYSLVDLDFLNFI